MTHTKGPWIIAPASNPKIGTEWREIHAKNTIGAPIYVAEALGGDAYLISAAPDMLSALESCCDAIQRLAKESPDGVPMWASAAHDSAKAAIAKAHGF